MTAPYTEEQLSGFVHKTITFAGQSAVVLCDGNCRKAWGVNSRPKVVLTKGDDDDYFYIPDGELGVAPEDPGTYEGGCGKPSPEDGPDRMNTWCVRECERSLFLDPRRDAFEHPMNFSRKVYNSHARQVEADLSDGAR
jgi:hypothetical protein